jgi:membrane protein required for beta-lactamase induction
VLAAPAVAVVVTTAAFYGLHRLRSPIEPVVVICAAMAIASLGPVRRRLDAWVEGWPGSGGHREQRAAQDDRTAPRGARADVTDPAVASGGRS